MADDWAEIKRLAADFQQIQHTTVAQQLSERNCIEIVSWLVERNLIELIFTTDGKEYLTHAQLLQEMQNELYGNGGRIQLGDLCKAIGVDVSILEAQLHTLLKSRKDIQNVLGQLIDNNYTARIAGEINQKLQTLGIINIGDLSIEYDLPSSFLQEQVVEKHLGSIIHGKQEANDPKVFFTESFIARSKAKLRGCLAGLTRPTPVASILNQIGIKDKLFFSLFDEVSMFGSLTCKLPGAQYIPNCYARSQNEWTGNFYRQNGYLEFDALSRIGISDHKTYLKKHFGNEDFLFLESVVVSKNILDRIEADIDECLSSKSYLDLQGSLPSVFGSKDISLILDKLLLGHKRTQAVIVDNFVLSKAFIDQLVADCDDNVKERAKNIVETGQYQKYITDVQGNQGKSPKVDEGDEKTDKREERRKKATGGKSGGGTQGRETKTRSVKKFPRGGHKLEVDDDVSETKRVLNIVTEENVNEWIEETLEREGLDTLVEPLIEYLLPKLNERGLSIAADVFQSRIADQTATRRKTHNELQEKLNDLVGEVRLFSKGLKLLPNDVQPPLTKYLLKTISSDIVTEVLNYVAAETLSNTQTDNFNNDQRMKFVNELPEEFKTPLQPLVKSLSGQNVEDFMNAIDASLAACSMILKKIDKKKDRTVVLNHKHKLLEELGACEDVGLVLHLATLVIFISATQCMVHASGRHVSSILSFLKPLLAEGQFSELMAYHDFVTLMLSNGSEAENAKEKLKEKMQTVKTIASEYKHFGSGGEKSAHSN